MDIKTETGIILQHLNYEDYQVQRFDDLVFHLYCIPMNERVELLAALVYQFHVNTNSEEFKAKFKQFDEILTNRNR
jgi:hypothetical protein